MSCATSPDCEIDKVLWWPPGKKYGSADAQRFERLTLCTGHSAFRRVALELADERGRHVSSLEVSMVFDDRAIAEEAVGKENVIELRARRAEKRRKQKKERADGTDAPTGDR